jgi:hypothetical protein
MKSRAVMKQVMSHHPLSHRPGRLPLGPSYHARICICVWPMAEPRPPISLYACWEHASMPCRLCQRAQRCTRRVLSLLGEGADAAASRAGGSSLTCGPEGIGAPRRSRGFAAVMTKVSVAGIRIAPSLPLSAHCVTAPPFVSTETLVYPSYCASAQ